MQASPLARRLAWLRLGHAAPAALDTWAALKRVEPDVTRLAERLAALIAGDDDAFADLYADDRPVRLPGRLVARLRHADIARQTDAALERCERYPDHHLLTPADPGWPPRLAAIDDPPPMLSLTGQPTALHPPAVAIVGARRASRVGLETASAFGRGLADAGIAVVSGLAIGIDAAAHEGALAGAGVTVAVMATGADRIYPARHAALAERIFERGALVTEFPLGTPLEKIHFPKRNRLGSALSNGVVIIEAAPRSGTLTTAAHARAQNREIMVVPGSLSDPASVGGHALLRDGAALVLSAAHIVQTVLPSIQQELRGLEQIAQSSLLPLDAEQRCILTLLDREPIDLDRLAVLAKTDVCGLLGTLSQLELSGHATRELDGRYSRRQYAGAGPGSAVAGNPNGTTLDDHPRFDLD